MNIFVGNLTSAIGTEDLRQIFSTYGTVLNVRVTTDTRDNSHGNVYLVPDDAARRAILELDLMALQGRQISVRECAFREKRERRINRTRWLGIERRHHSGDRRQSAGLPDQSSYDSTRSAVQ